MDNTAFVPADAREHSVTILDSERLSSRYFMLRLERPADFPEPGAGRFLHLAIPNGGRFFLRRPFSIFDCTADTIELLVVEHGPGTQILRTLRAGESVDFYGPLGGVFPPPDGRRILAVAGGVGLAPLYYYGFRTVGGCGDGYRLLYGARTRDDLFLDHVPALEGDGVYLSTNDGSHGFEGTVVDLAGQQLAENPAEIIFSCGPTPMMQAVDQIARQLDIPHFVSLENRMGCALGACRACVVPTRLDGGSPYRTVCHDGPVFDAAQLIMDELPIP